MQESLLHYIWQFQYFDRTDLQTTSGEKIHVFNPGYYNTHAGPDFSDARIKIGDIEWVGHVEMHVQSSGWYEHNHHDDAAYDNVILHVVWNDDKPVVQRDNSKLYTLELQHKVDKELLLRYNSLVLNPQVIPCATSVMNVADLTRLSMFEKALMSRLQNKAGQMLQSLQSNNNDWEETCYQFLCRNFGFKVNADPFFALSKSLPYKVILKHADQQVQVEALLFGQAGFLEENSEDTYYHLLKREYKVLSQKFSLHDRKLHKAQWRFLRLRPANFPTIRLAQLAALMATHKNIFSHILAVRSYKELASLFIVDQSSYWKHHYMFDRAVEGAIPSLGKSSIDNLIINTAVPLMVAYGKAHDDQELIDRAVDILQCIPAEENNITRTWETLGITCKTSFDTQAAIELYNNFCLRKRCLECNIGASLIRPTA